MHSAVKTGMEPGLAREACCKVARRSDSISDAPVLDAGIAGVGLAAGIGLATWSSAERSFFGSGTGISLTDAASRLRVSMEGGVTVCCKVPGHSPFCGAGVVGGEPTFGALADVPLTTGVKNLANPPFVAITAFQL